MYTTRFLSRPDLGGAMCPKAAHWHPARLACSIQPSSLVLLARVLLASVILLAFAACAPQQRSTGPRGGTWTATASETGSAFTMFTLPAGQGRLGSLVAVSGDDIWL